MEIILRREYLKNGTNGVMQLGAKRETVACIELPWRDNLHEKSCIPEGRYRLRLRYSLRHHTHILVEEVPGRSLVLIHPANNALEELKGCIAPVTRITGEGQGVASVKAFKILLSAVQDALGEGPVFLTIKSK